ncbi:MAG: hypothetical protein E7012_02570 [Alphaproteobacteria bacterium]|nr:hypothetical protein [Alphaproteobacteria bacterium]
MIKNLIFDLDGTLYPISSGLETECQQRVYDFFSLKLSVSKSDAQNISKQLLQKYHYEAQGVEKELGISQEEFLEYICAVSTDNLSPNYELNKQLSQLPQRKIIYTDSTFSHVRDVLNKTEVDINLFADIYDAAKGNFQYKLNANAFINFCNYYKIIPSESIFFEDRQYNISLAKSVGFKTVFIDEDEQNCKDADYNFKSINQALIFLKDYLL